MKNTLSKIARAALCIVGFAVILASVAAALLGGAVKFFLTDKDFYVGRIVTDEYINDIYEVAQIKIKNTCGKLGFDYGAVSDCVDKNAVGELSREYVADLFDSLKSGEKNEEVSYPSDAFLAAINEYADAKGGEINEAYGQADTRETLAKKLAANVADALNSFSNQTITKNLHGILFENEYLKLLVKLFYPAVAAALLFAALMIFFGAKGGKGAYLAALAAYTGALLCYLPVNTLRCFDISKVILRGAAYAFLLSAWNGVLGSLCDFLLICVIAAAALVIVSIVVINLPRKKKPENEADGTAEQTPDEPGPTEQTDEPAEEQQPDEPAKEEQ